MTSDNKNDIVKLFLCAARSHHRAFEKAAGEFGVHRSQHRILMFLSKRGDVQTTQKDIAANFEISAAAVAVSIKKLEEDGFITRQSDKSDNRANLIRLTDKGMKIVSDTQSLIHELDSAMFDGFGNEETERFSEYLSRLCDNIRNFTDTHTKKDPSERK